ncbi:hypothetical protein RhiirC2_849086 [Rhizophagus irregularis]|uniref:Uncharacterized protein n=1 Tax=Rhizophagus irregularis TaxID=588596 RepID=A0A2N1NCM0_9GLOM|nr:hypothetical protein RhiirC2_849086 [Rhizophagus irregularis]
MSQIDNNKENIENILSRVKDENLTIRYWDHYAPSFGSGDLTIYGGYGGLRNESNFCSNGYNYCRKAFYEKNIRVSDYTFSVEDYEWFQGKGISLILRNILTYDSYNKRKERKERSFQAILDNHEIELRTSKDNENENSEARDNITYNEIRLFCRLRKLQKPISFFQKLILLE